MAKAKKPRRGARKKAASKKRAAKPVRSKASAVWPPDCFYSAGTCSVASYHPTATQIGGWDLPKDDDDDCQICFITGVLFAIAAMIVISWLWWVFS